MRAEIEKIGEVPHLLDLDLGAGLRLRLFGAFALVDRRPSRDRFRLDEAYVGMMTGEKPPAAVAAPARRRARLGRLAQQQLREALCELQLADALRPVQQQRVRRLLGQPDQPAPDVLLEGRNRHDAPNSRCRSSALRIWSIEPAPSTSF